MEPAHLTINTYTAEQLETFFRDPKTRPDQLSSRVLEALIVGHPLTRTPVHLYKGDRSVGDSKFRSRAATIGELGLCCQRLCWRLLLPYLLLGAGACFVCNLVRDARLDAMSTLALDGRQLVVNSTCQAYFDTVPVASACYGVLAVSALALLLVSMATRSWAVCVTDHVVRRTIFVASQHIVRRIHHLYGLFHTADTGDNDTTSQPICYHAYRLLESGLRNKLFLAVCNGITALLCLLCLVTDTNYELLVLRWQVVIVILLSGFFCCILSSDVKRVHWQKVLHLLPLAASLLLINKVDGVNRWLIMVWQMPLQFVHSIRSMEVFNRTAGNLQSVLETHDAITPPGWFFTHIQHLAFIFTFSFLLRLINFRRKLNLFQVLFRYNLLLEPVESVTFLVAVCHLPPIISILLLRSQLKLMTSSELDSLLLTGFTQSLFTSSRPVNKGYNDFITNSRRLCTLVPLATICAIMVSSITSPAGEQSNLLLNSQATYKHRMAFGRGLRRMLMKKTRMGCRLLLLLIVSHELIGKAQFCMQLVIGLMAHNYINYRTILLNTMHYFLLSTGTYLRSGSSLFNLIFDNSQSVERLLKMDFLLKESYVKFIRTPTDFMVQAELCTIWSNMSRNVVEMMDAGAAPLLDTRVEHSAFLLLLRIAQNGAPEMTLFVCLLLVNVSHRSKLSLLASLPKQLVSLAVTVALVFAMVNFVSSISFY